MSLGNISGYLSANNIIEAVLNECENNFPVDYRAFDTNSNIIDIDNEKT